MNLSPMRFKDFIWPYNPRSYAIEYRRELVTHKVPQGAYVLQSLGLTGRVLKGEGEFAGPGAYGQFSKLASVFYGNAPGLLVHPVWQSSLAYFASLSLRQEPTVEYVAYAFEFRECYSHYQLEAKLYVPETGGSVGVEPQYYVAVWGDTMWGIAIRHGLTLEGLLALNPQVKNPNFLYVGDRLRVA